MPKRTISALRWIRPRWRLTRWLTTSAPTTPPRTCAPAGRAPRREQRTLTERELGRLLDVAREQLASHFAEIVVLAYTGMRVGEMYALQWEDIDWEREAIEIQRAVSRGHVTTPKTGVGRSVYMPPPVAAALRAHRQEQLRAGAAPLVFPSTTGGHRATSGLRKALELAAEGARIDVHVTPQVLRRTFNTLMMAAGVDRIVLRAQMGHTREDMTIRYSGVGLDLKREGWTRTFGAGDEG